MGATDLDILGELETTIKAAPGYTLIEKMRRFDVFFLFAAALNRKHTFPDFDAQVVFAKAGNGQRNPVVVFVGSLDVVGRIARTRIVLTYRVEHVGEAIKADGGTEKRGKIKATHGSYPPLEATYSGALKAAPQLVSESRAGLPIVMR
jgi:hypothetical protein